MLPALVACATVCSLLLAAWAGASVVWRRQPARVDRLCAACFFALAITSVVALRCLVTAPDGRGPLPFFVFFGAPIGFYLAWLSLRLARTRAPARP